MKRFGTISLLLVLFFGVSAVDVGEAVPPNGNKLTFGPGEVITYKVHYGPINAAKAEMIISDDAHRMNGKSCYKIDIHGTSIGMFDVFMKIRDNWGSYLDTANFRPTRSYRKIREGKYRKNEYVNFNHQAGIASVNEYSFSGERWKEPVDFDVPTNVQDLVSGYYYLRTLDFEGLNAGDVIKLDAFFEDKLYDFRIRIKGREVVKTNLGKIRAIVLSPIMPENSLFDGENSIQVWISDDRNKVPLKVKAKMFVGSVEIDIETYKQGKVK